MKRRDEVNRIVTDAIIKSDYGFLPSAFYDVADECSETMIHKAFDWFIQNYQKYITVTMSEEYYIESEIKINDMWETYKKAMEE